MWVPGHTNKIIIETYCLFEAVIVAIHVLPIHGKIAAKAQILYNTYNTSESMH